MATEAPIEQLGLRVMSLSLALIIVSKYKYNSYLYMH